MNRNHQDNPNNTYDTINRTLLPDKQNVRDIPDNRNNKLDIHETNDIHDELENSGNASLHVIPFAIIVFYNVCGTSTTI